MVLSENESVFYSWYRFIVDIGKYVLSMTDFIEVSPIRRHTSSVDEDGGC